MNLSEIEALGLTPKEVDVYIALLRFEDSSIFDIMNRANVSRKSIYEILQKLLDKGLVSYTIQNNKKKFTAVSPERFIDILNEKKANIEQILPELLNKYKASKKETFVRVYVGKEGIKTLLNNIIKEGKPYCVLANEGKIFDVIKYSMMQFANQCARQKIIGKIVYSEVVRKKKDIMPPTKKIRYISSDYASSPISFAIYSDNVNINIFSESPIAIHVKSKEMAHSFMNYFNLMWAIGKK